MKIIVTGSAGFIGSCFLSRLNAAGISDILVVDHLDESEKWKNLVGKNIADYVDKTRFLSLLEQAGNFKGTDCVIHLGACSSTTETDAAYLMDNNYLYSKTLAQWSLKRGIKFIYASSAATYGGGEAGYKDDDATTCTLRPLNLYGYSKQLFDLWVVRNGLQKKFTGLKFFNVFGPNEYHKGGMRSLVCKAFPEASSGGPVKLFKSYLPGFSDGEQKRDFVYVKDVSEIIFFFLQNPGISGIFNVGSGRARSWNSLAKALFSAIGLPEKIEYIEMPESIRDKYQYFTEANISKLASTGFRHSFFSLEDAVKDYAGYLKAGAHI